MFDQTGPPFGPSQHTGWTGLYAGIICIAVVAIVATVSGQTLRKRHGQPGQEEEPGSAEGDGLVAPHSESVWAGPPRTATFASVIFGVLFLAFSAGGLVYFLVQEDRGPGSPSKPCKLLTAQERVQRYGDLGGFHYPILTSSTVAQKLFDIGLLLEWDFNQEEAARSFRLAIQEDPKAAMNYWGLAYSLGPFHNRVSHAARAPYPSYTPDDHEKALEAARQSVEAAQLAAKSHPDSKAAEKELALAHAAEIRFEPGTALQPERNVAQSKFAEEMARIARKYSDSYILAMAAEAFMDLTPWDYYLGDGSLRESAAKAESLIMETLQMDPDNPLALHLLIHVTEASKPLRRGSAGFDNLSVGRAEDAADKIFSGQGPWKKELGHLRHMPSHTFVRIGRYHDAVLANIAAYEADVADAKACQESYGPEHNTDMLIYAANFGGQASVAESYSRIISFHQQKVLGRFAYTETRDWTHLPLTWVMHAQWSKLAELHPPPSDARGMCPSPDANSFAQAVWHYVASLSLAAKSKAWAALGDSSAAQLFKDKAKLQLQELKDDNALVADEMPFGTKPGQGVGLYGCDHKALLNIFTLMAEAGLAVLEKNFTAAEEPLQRAVEIEDNMGYMEPPRLHMPVRHCLGYVLLQAGKAADAEQVFRAAEELHPNNAWALFGLAESLNSLGQKEDGLKAGALWKEAWKYGEYQLKSACPAFSEVAWF